MKQKVNKTNLMHCYVLKNCSPKHDKYVILKNNLVYNASKFYEWREKMIERFKNGLFPIYYDRDYEERMKFEKKEKKKKKEHLMQLNLMNGLINKKQT